MVRGSNPSGARFSAPVQTGPGAHPASCTMGTESFPGVKSGRGMMLTPHRLLVPRLWKSRAIPLLPLWAVRPVQSLSACTRVHFTFTLSCSHKHPQSEFFLWFVRPTDTWIQNYRRQNIIALFKLYVQLLLLTKKCCTIWTYKHTCVTHAFYGKGTRTKKCSQSLWNMNN
jgi:hypothetical protein